MTTNWVSPGTYGSADTVISVSDNQLPSSVLRPHFFPKRVLAKGGAQVFRPMGHTKGVTMRINVRGANVVSAHAQAFTALLPGAIANIQSNTGLFATQAAQSIVPVDVSPSRDDIVTRNTIHPQLDHSIGADQGSITVRIGPTTFYAPFIEYGLGGHSHIGPRPFMTDTFFRIAPHWYQAFIELGKVARGGKFIINEPLYGASLNAYLGKWRKWLYTREKQLGDINPLGIGPSTAAQRGFAIATARILGDIQAAVGRTVGLRFQRRLTGKVTGRLIGFGSHTIFTNVNYQTRISLGPRIYNRFAGRAVTKYIDQNESLAGITGG